MPLRGRISICSSAQAHVAALLKSLTHGRRSVRRVALSIRYRRFRPLARPVRCPPGGRKTGPVVRASMTEQESEPSAADEPHVGRHTLRREDDALLRAREARRLAHARAFARASIPIPRARGRGAARCAARLLRSSPNRGRATRRACLPRAECARQARPSLGTYPRQARYAVRRPSSRDPKGSTEPRSARVGEAWWGGARPRLRLRSSRIIIESMIHRAPFRSSASDARGRGSSADAEPHPRRLAPRRPS
jgi:hypothetical protein